MPAAVLEVTEDIRIPGFKDYDPTNTDHPHLLIVHNNDEVSYEDTIAVLVDACKCSEDRASEYAHEIDQYKSAIVLRSTKKKCEKAATIISKIKLRTEIIPS